MAIGKKTVIASLIYKFTERLAVKGAGLVIGIILARLLVPEEFGQVAIITVFINLANSIIQNGFNSALVQQKEVDDKDYSTVFYITGVLSLVIIGIMYISAPYIALYYETPTLVWPIRVYSFSLIFGAFNSIQVAKIQREMRFKPMMYASLVATLLSGVLGVAMAYMNFGIWALVAYGCSNVVFSCITMLPASRWLPKITFSFGRAKTLFSFGSKMLVSSVLCSVYNDIRSLIIGKIYSVEDLSYYNRGQQYPVVITTTIDVSIQSVMFPVMSSVQDDLEKVKTILKKSISFCMFFITPIMVGLCAAAEPVIRILLTDKWLPSVFFMQMICISECFVPISFFNLIAIKSIGRSDIYMRSEFLRRLVMLVILAISVLCFSSVEAIVVGQVISSIIDVLIVLFLIKRTLNYTILEQIKNILPVVFASAIMGVLVYLFTYLPFNAYIVLFVQIIVAVISYCGICYMLKVESLLYLIGIWKSIVKKRI